MWSDRFVSSQSIYSTNANSRADSRRSQSLGGGRSTGQFTSVWGLSLGRSWPSLIPVASRKPKMPQRQETQRTLHGDVIAPSHDRAVAPSVEPGVYSAYATPESCDPRSAAGAHPPRLPRLCPRLMPEHSFQLTRNSTKLPPEAPCHCTHVPDADPGEHITEKNTIDVKQVEDWLHGEESRYDP